MENIKLILSSSIPPDYSSKDENLIPFSNLNETFGYEYDYIENYIYSGIDNLIYSDNNYKRFKIQNNNQIDFNNNLSKGLYIDPINDLKILGLNKGNYKVQYNFYRKIFNSEFNNSFIIKEISSDRTELKLINTFIPISDIENQINIFKSNNSEFYNDFLLNFGNNEQLIGVNIDTDNNSILVKLYQPLPLKYEINTTLSLVIELSEPYVYDVSFINDNNIDENIPLKGPNFYILDKEKNNTSTDYLNYNDLFSTTVTSSYQQLSSILEEKGIKINIDYSDYSNFTHFGSAKERLLNFLYKLKLIEGYNRDIISLNNISGSTSGSYYVSSSKAIVEDKVKVLINQFDGYEKFLYYESGSKSWPKQNNIKPYILYSTTSSVAIDWFGNDIDNLSNTNYGGQILSASVYDNNNQNNLLNLVPLYIREDEQNQSYLLFVNMIGQYFDNLWTYSKAITDIYDADNRLDKGISKDLVSYALKSFGIKLYNNNYTNNGLFEYILGVNSSGSYLPTTSSFETLVTASVSGSTFQTTITEDINKEILKRIYHNLPYLLKTKGTERGLKALLACYGIPSTILRINEFGSNDKLASTEDFYYDKYFYGVHLNGQDSFIARWKPLLANSMSYGERDTVPDTIEFRFNTLGLIPSNTYLTQSLFQVFNGGANTTHFGVRLTYPQSSTGSYTEYGNISLVMSGAFGYYTTTPIYLPVFDGNWWNVMIKRENHLVHSNSASNNTYLLYVKNSIYNGHDGNQIGFQGSASILVDGSTSSSYNNSWHDEIPSVRAYLGYNPNGGIIASNNSYFTGSFQELRYWSTPLSENAFNKHVLNPESIEGDSISASYYFLNVRYPLGTNLKTYNHYNVPGVESVHPDQSTQSFIITSGPSISYSSYMTASFATSNTNSYLSFTQKYYFNNPNVGSLTRVSDKIRIISSSIITGSIYSSSFWTYNLSTESVLSPYVSVENKLNDYNSDSNVIEVTFSPQDEINDDIIQQLGFFNIDEYIGDPRQQTGSIYPSLDTLNKFYFSKYSSSYNLYDYIRLIKYFDNSLFKIIKDFTPARTNTTTGITIKPHILERYRIPLLPITFSQSVYTSSVEIGTYTGDSGGTFELGHTSSFTESVETPYGIVNIIHNDNMEFYQGNLSGSNLKVTNQSLNNNPFLNPLPEILYDYIHTTSSIYFDSNNPSSGQIIIYSEPSVILIGVYQAYSIKVHNTSKNNVNLSNTLPYLNKLTLTYTSSIATGIFNITQPTLNFSEKYPITPDIFYYKVGFSNYFTNINTSSVWTNPDRITLFYPFYPQNFIKSEYDVIGNNASESRKSTKYQNVDYIINQQTPVNFNYLILNSGSRADILDSNYTTFRHIRPRYEGCVYGIFSSNNPIGNTNINKNNYANRVLNFGTQSIDNFKSYFGYFTNLVLQAPDYGTYIGIDNNYTKGFLKYLIDKNGNIIELEGNTNYNVEMVQNLFPDERTVRISLTDAYLGGVDMSSLNGLKNVKFGGKVSKNIWYTQTGSSAKSVVPYKMDTNNDGIYETSGNLITAVWGTGSSGNVLTSSTHINALYNYYYYNDYKIKQSDWNNAEFDNIDLDFTIEKGDQIRFANNETNTYTITSIIPSGSDGNTTGLLELKVDRNITGSFNSGIFVLRRIVNNESLFLLDTTKPAGATSDGFIFPEDMEPELSDNISNIIEDLYTRGILIKS